MIPIGEQVKYLIDARLEDKQDPFRHHLGASIVGDKCMRQVWFKFRWAKRVLFDGRMLRLFERGHKTEPRVVNWLRSIGCTVWDTDAEGNQFRIKEHGHYGGSCDGVAIGIPGLPPDLPVLLEIKTHNDKWFSDLVKKGVHTAQPKHVKQAQAYMRGLGLSKCLYCAINKNDDSLHFELFDADSAAGEALSKRAYSIIYEPELPPRIAERSSWYECRFCDFRGVCFETEMPHVNCRTCVYARPLPDGSWSCAKGQPNIKEAPESSECPSHIFSPLLFPQSTVVAYDLDAGFITYKMRTGGSVTNNAGGSPWFTLL